MLPQCCGTHHIHQHLIYMHYCEFLLGDIKKPESQFILEARASMEMLNEVFKHMFWAEQGRANCVGYNHKQSSLKRALILKGLQKNNQFMCTITKSLKKK